MFEWEKTEIAKIKMIDFSGTYFDKCETSYWLKLLC